MCLRQGLWGPIQIFYQVLAQGDDPPSPLSFFDLGKNDLTSELINQTG